MRIKRRMTAVLALATAVFMLAGCGNGNEAASTASGSSGGSNAKTKLEIAQISWGASIPENDFVKQKLDESLNIDLTHLLVADQKDYENQINVRAASNNLPDLFMATSKAHAQQLAESGMLLDLTPYLDQLTDYTAFAGEDALKKGVVSGKQYVLPKAGQGAVYTYWIRKDWLDALNLSTPTTVDELFDVAKAFTENDPDGNGKKDTFGLTGTALSTFEPIYGAYGVTATGAFFQKESGEVVNTYYQPEMKEALAAVKKFLDAGVVDPEVISNKGTAARDKAFQGKVGIINSEWAQFMKEDVMKIWKDANPNAEWIQLSPPVGPTGLAHANSINIGAASGLFAIPKSLEKQPEKLDKIFRLLNYLSTEEGNRLVQFGLEGTHFTQADGNVSMTDKGIAETDFTWLYQYTGRNETDYLKVKFPAISSYIDFEAGLPRIQTLDGYVQNPPEFNAADAARFIEEETFEFIYGKRDLGQYDAFIETLESSFNYKIYVDSAVEQLKALGFGQ